MVRFILCFLVICFIQNNVWAQNLVKIDPTPFEKPMSFGSIETENPDSLLDEIIDSVKSYDFQISKKDRNSFFIEARRRENSTEIMEDRILLWLVRDPIEPLQRVDIYFLYGRFEEVWTRDGLEISRIMISPNYEEEKIGKLRQSIYNLTLR